MTFYSSNKKFAKRGRRLGAFLRIPLPIGSMGLVYSPTFTIKINYSKCRLNIPYMDPMGYEKGVIVDSLFATLE